MSKTKPAAQNTAVIERPLKKELISFHELPSMGINYSINHLRRMWNDDPPKFPRPHYPSTRRFGWYPQELEDWIANATTEPPAPAARKAATRKPVRLPRRSANG